MPITITANWLMETRNSQNISRYSLVNFRLCKYETVNFHSATNVRQFIQSIICCNTVDIIMNN